VNVMAAAVPVLPLRLTVTTNWHVPVCTSYCERERDRARKSTAHYSDLVRFAAAGIRELVRNETGTNARSKEPEGRVAKLSSGRTKKSQAGTVANTPTRSVRGRE